MNITACFHNQTINVHGAHNDTVSYVPLLAEQKYIRAAASDETSFAREKCGGARHTCTQSRVHKITLCNVMRKSFHFCVRAFFCCFPYSAMCFSHKRLGMKMANTYGCMRVRDDDLLISSLSLFLRWHFVYTR